MTPKQPSEERTSVIFRETKGARGWGGGCSPLMYTLNRDASGSTDAMPKASCRTLLHMPSSMPETQACFKNENSTVMRDRMAICTTNVSGEETAALEPIARSPPAPTMGAGTGWPGSSTVTLALLPAPPLPSSAVACVPELVVDLVLSKVSWSHRVKVGMGAGAGA